VAIYTARTIWQRAPEESFTDNRYSRRHRLVFDGGAEWVGSSSPGVVPLPFSDASAVDPEEAFVSSLSSCHMLWFLSLAAEKGFTVDHYDDAAEGVMARNAQRQMVMSTVTLRPRVSFSGRTRPTAEQFQALHHDAHAQCFIANSVKTDVRCEAAMT
jgi:organic hydroperoxide reductase OsmC/OhrA